MTYVTLFATKPPPPISHAKPYTHDWRELTEAEQACVMRCVDDSIEPMTPRVEAFLRRHYGIVRH